MNLTYIYTLSDKNGVVRYVGKTNTPRKRLYDHIQESLNFKIPSHKKNWIKSLLEKDERPIIDVIDEVSESEWPFWEQYWIDQIKSWGFNLTNSTEGGEGGNGYKHTESSRSKMRESKLGKKLPESHRKNIGTALKEGYKKEDFRPNRFDKKVILDKEELYQKYIVENLSMPQCSEYFKCSETSIFRNIKEFGFEKPKEVWSKQLSTREKLIINQYDLDGKFIKTWEGAATIENEVGFDSCCIIACCNGRMNKSHGYIWRFVGDEIFRNTDNSKKPKEVVQIKDGQIINEFESVSDAARKTNIIRSSITYCCKGKLKSSGGFIWKFKDNI